MLTYQGELRKINAGVLTENYRALYNYKIRIYFIYIL